MEGENERKGKEMNKKKGNNGIGNKSEEKKEIMRNKIEKSLVSSYSHYHESRVHLELNKILLVALS